MLELWRTGCTLHQTSILNPYIKPNQTSACLVGTFEAKIANRSNRMGCCQATDNSVYTSYCSRNAGGGEGGGGGRREG